MTQKMLWAIYILCGVLFLAWSLIAVSWDTQDPTETHEVGTITILKPWVKSTLSWMPVIAGGSLLLITIWPIRLIESRHRLGAFLFAVIGFVVSCVAHLMTNLIPWTEHGSIRDIQGNEYVFCDRSFLQGQTMAITKVAGSTNYTATYKVLGTNNGDSPHSFLTIVRPSDSTESYGQLYLANNQWLLGIRYENNCYLAYDLVNQKFYGHGDIEKLSPFIALNTEGKLNSRDVSMITQLLQGTSAYRDGRPSKEGIEQGLQHPNPEVRLIAEEWLMSFK